MVGSVIAPVAAWSRRRTATELTTLGSGSAVAGIAVGIVGVLSGLEATRTAGFSFGDLISYGPKVAAYRHLINSRPADDHDQVAVRPEQGIEVTQITVSYPGSDHPAVTDVSLQAGPGLSLARIYLRDSPIWILDTNPPRRSTRRPNSRSSPSRSARLFPQLALSRGGNKHVGHHP